METVDLTVLVTAAIALIGTLIAIWTRLGGVKVSLEALVKRVDHDSDERLRIWHRIDDHEKRLTRAEVLQEKEGT